MKTIRYQVSEVRFPMGKRNLMPSVSRPKMGVPRACRRLKRKNENRGPKGVGVAPSKAADVGVPPSTFEREKK